MLKIMEEHDGLFSILWDDLEVIRHSKKNPFLIIGSGEGCYRMRHGSFKISQQIQERVPQLEYSLSGKGLGELILDFELIKVRFLEKEGRLHIYFEPIEKCYNRCWIRLSATLKESIYGGGEQYSVINLRGRKLPVWCEEQGIGRGKDLITLVAETFYGAGGSWYTTYFPQPSFISNNGWYCLVESYSYMEMDFRHKKHHQLSIWEIPERIVLGKADSTAELISGLSELIGRQPSLPDWALDGVWLGIQGGKNIVNETVNKALEAGVKIAAVWAQDWQGIRITRFGKQLMWNWKYDKELYHNLPGFINELNGRKIKFLGYINPFLALDGDLYREAASKGYLVKNKKGEDYHVYVTTFPVVMVDLSNPKAFTWIKEVIKKNMIELGLSGWMADFAEYLPVDAVLYSNESGETFHNLYPVLWAKANREAILEAGKEKEVTFFSRSGFTGTSRYSPLVWAGDQLVNWSKHDGLPTVVPAGISLGLSGIGHYHSDIGGFTTGGWIRRSKELFMRWTEHSAFTAVMRNHEGNRPDLNWHFDSDRETLLHFARMSKIHVHIKPYLQNALLEYQNHGLPLMRHLLLHYEDESEVYNLMYQYLLGRDLLVAPILQKRKWRQRLYLPDDNWVHLWTGRRYRRGWWHINAPLGYPPVFYREASDWVELFGDIKKMWT